jgi:hypothetical protein
MAISTTYVSSLQIKSKQLEDQTPKDVKGLIQIYCNFRSCIFCILLDQEAWDKVLYRLISKHF